MYVRCICISCRMIVAVVVGEGCAAAAVLAVFALPETLEELRVAGCEVVGADAGFAQVAG